MERAFQIITGRLLRYYRENYRHPNGKVGLSIRELSRLNSARIQEIRAENGVRLNQKSICSTSRISDIENGQDSMEDYVIECLASVYARKYLYKEIYWLNLKKDIQAIVDEMTRMEKEGLARLNLKLRSQYQKLSHYLVYGEMLEILSAVLTYLNERVLPKAELQRKMEALLPTGMLELDSLLLYMKSEYHRKMGQPGVTLAEIECALGNQRDFLSLELRFKAYMDHYQVDLAKKTLQMIRELATYASSPYLQFIYHNHQALIYENSCSTQAVGELQACRKLLESGRLNGCLHVQGRYYHNLGMHFYAHHQYANALSMLQKALKWSPDLVLQAFPYVMDCAERLELPLAQCRQLLEWVDFVHMSGFKLEYAKYFRLKYSYDTIGRKEALLLEKFLVENILPFLDSGLLTYALFYRQLLILSPLTRHMQYVLQFHEM